jgi:hypothetical protein
LYYAGISAVGSSIYASVPNNIRGLLAHDRFGNVYMRFLAFLTSLCLILIAFRIANLPRVYLAIPLITVAAGIGIFAFVKLGQRAFDLFDPTALSHHIFEQMQQSLEIVKAGGFKWADKSFQHHAHKKASTTLDTLDTLVDITAKGPHLNGPFVYLTNNILRFLIYYEYSKRNIPTDSGWYEQKYQHRDWYRTEDTHVTIAHQTGTSIQPIVVNNREWIEDRAQKIITRCIETNLASAKYSEVLSIFEYLNAYIKTLAMEGQVDRAFSLMEILTLTVLDSIAKLSPATTEEKETLERLSIVEYLALLPITATLGYLETLEELNRRDVELRISSVNWSNSTSIYKAEFPSYCLSRLEWLKPRLAFEEEIEGHQVSPDWYKAELILQVEAEQFCANTKCLISRGSELFASLITKTADQKRPWLTAAVMSREWEYWHKIEHQLEIWPSKWNELSLHRKIEDLPWPAFDFKTLRTESMLRREELLKEMSKQNLLLALLKKPDDFPDYAGQFLHTSGEMALEALLANNANLLKNVFKPYMMGCLFRFDALRPKTGATDWRAQQDFKIAAAALLDLMDISGYAKLLSDYHKNDSLWHEITIAWDDYLNNKSGPSPIPLLAAAISLTDTAFELPHRGILRTTWQQKIRQLLANVPRHEEYAGGHPFADTEIDHESPLIRIFARGSLGSFHEGIDIFITLYLRNLEGAKDINFDWKRRDLQDSIEREMKRTEGRKEQ